MTCGIQSAYNRVANPGFLLSCLLSDVLGTIMPFDGFLPLDKRHFITVLVVTKLDRFARTAIDSVSAVRELFDRGIRVHILNMGLVENTLTGNLILTVMLAFAEYERGMIVERIQTGKAIARQDPNFREGRPKKFTAVQIQHAMELLDSGKSYKQVEAMTGISKSTLMLQKSPSL